MTVDQEQISENRESGFRDSHEQVHQKSQNRKMRFPDTKDSVWVTKKDQSRPSGRTRGKGSSDIGKSEFLRSKETRDRKSRNPEGIGTVHLRDRCRKSGVSRHIANREIGVPKVKRNRTSEVPKSRHNRDRPSERMRGRILGHWRKAR